jgi:hypothetical protein
MRTKKFYLAGMILLSFMLTTVVVSQVRPEVLVVTKAHWNMHMEDDADVNWLDIEKEYFEKVTSKNELIVTSEVLNHYFTDDNSEILFANTYRSWEDVEKAAARSDELAKEAWPDEAERKAFFKKQSAFYSNKHSDEIYSTLPGAKMLAEKSPEPMVYYVRISHLSFPEGGKTEEIRALREEYINAVVLPNPYVKGYYPSRHRWGADARDFVEAFVVESLADLPKAFDANSELIKDHWPEEEARKDFFTKMNKYFTGWHGDYIYQNVPELSK